MEYVELLIRVNSYKVRRAGKRGLTITLPAIWADDIGINPGDKLDIYRDNKDRLVIAAGKAV